MIGTNSMRGSSITLPIPKSTGQNPINYRFAISGGESKLYEQGSDPVLWWEDYTDVARGRPRAGMLDRCRAGNTCPKITEVNGAAEYWDLRMSPGIIGTSAPVGLVNTVIDYDYGPNFIYNDMSGYITTAPIVIEKLIPTYVPQVDNDGNEVAGVQPLLKQLPLGTYTGWNVTTNSFYKGQICAFTGGFIPFARTKAERLANGDPRRSLEERYGNIDRYLHMANGALQRLVAQRFLLPADADATWNRLLSQLQSNNILPPKN